MCLQRIIIRCAKENKTNHHSRVKLISTIFTLKTFQVVVCTNLLAISVVFYRMRTVKSARDEDLVRSACKWARGVAVLVPLLGLPWLVGLFMYSQDPYVVVGAAFLFNVFLVLQVRTTLTLEASVNYLATTLY